MIDCLSIYDEHTIYKKIGNHGYVRLVDVMPRLVEEGESCDYAVIDAARTSYQAGTKRTRTDAGLINYLLRNKHTSPFEQVIFKFEVRAPLFVMRQWHRHRTASLNEESARYSELADDFWLPDTLREQATTNKQSSSGVHPDSASFLGEMDQATKDAFVLYQKMLEAGVAREQARACLPVSIYSKMVWSMDLKNLLDFIRLRADHHAQQEIQDYAVAILSFVEDLCPLTYAAFNKYSLHQHSFSQPELEIIKSLVGTTNLIKPEGFSQTEWADFIKKVTA